MSSLSATRAARRLPRVPADDIRTLALAGLLLFVVATQLDAVANTLSQHLHVSIVQLAVASALVGGVLTLGTQRLAPIPAAARAMLGFLLWAVVSWTLCDHVSAGLTYLVKLATAILPALALMAIVQTPRDVRAVVWAVILASAVSAVIVLIEAHTHTRLVATSLAATTADFDGVARSSGGSDQNATSAAQMLMTGFALAAGWAASGARRWRIVLAGIAMLGAVALALMSARSAILGAGMTVALILWSFRRSRYFPLLMVAALAGGVIAVMVAPPTLAARFAAIGDFGRDQTLFRRVTYLRIGLDLVGQSPVWGIGPGNFPLYYVGDAYRWMPGRELIPRELHNTYLDVATELGLVGLAIFLAILAGALRAAIRGAKASPDLARISFAVGVSLAALLVGAVFMPHKDMRYLWMMLALAFRCGALARREERP